MRLVVLFVSLIIGAATCVLDVVMAIQQLRDSFGNNWELQLPVFFVPIALNGWSIVIVTSYFTGQLCYWLFGMKRELAEMQSDKTFLTKPHRMVHVCEAWLVISFLIGLRLVWVFRPSVIIACLFIGFGLWDIAKFLRQREHNKIIHNLNNENESDPTAVG